MNTNLNKAKKAKNDEFYTCLTDIERELNHYKNQLAGKIIYCNCDSVHSNFVKYFVANFKVLGLKRLIYSCLDGYKVEYDGRAEFKEVINGDFRSGACRKLLDKSDIVISNPPFSLFREYMSLLIESGKKFLVIGNKNAVICKEIFPLIRDSKLRLGYYSPSNFILPDGLSSKSINGLCRWFTNLYTEKFVSINCNEKYTPDTYPRYDNFDAINVDKVNKIPMGYNGVMGVPVTFLDKFNSDQFEIIGVTSVNHEVTGLKSSTNQASSYIKGKKTYARLFIKAR